MIDVKPEKLWLVQPWRILVLLLVRELKFFIHEGMAMKSIAQT